ncbi:hypothetical protein [Sphingomonas crusticola]|uniref:hypothetical protein n=1 Tax=Sphingomonas crusticola TaxID=1697973 RepID=UPI0013C2A367|nr:hypothetical protein [Sphingomonas crusticola]
MGIDDHLFAGAGAFYDAYHGKPIFDSYRHRVQAQHELDRLDAKEHPVARGWGKGLGAALQLAGSGGLSVIGRGGVRLAETAPIIAKELKTLAGAGGLAGIGGQYLADPHSTLGDYAGAGLGGVAEGLMAPRGQPGQASTVGGFVSSLAQDAFNGRRPSLQKALENASTARLWGSAGGAAGRRLFERLPGQQMAKADLAAMPQGYKPPLNKEEIGESLSKARIWAAGDTVLPGKKQRVFLKGGGSVIPDFSLASGVRRESKAGISARLKRWQPKAKQQLGDNFLVDHFLPQDMGLLHGYPAGLAGYHLQDEWQRRERNLRN